MTTGARSGQEDYVSVSTTCLDLGDIAAIVADPRAGATSTFSGTTRDNHFGEKPTGRQAGRQSRGKLQHKYKYPTCTPVAREGPRERQRNSRGPLPVQNL